MTSQNAPRWVRQPAQRLNLRSPLWLVAFIAAGWTALGLLIALGR